MEKVLYLVEYNGFLERPINIKDECFYPSSSYFGTLRAMENILHERIEYSFKCFINDSEVYLPFIRIEENLFMLEIENEKIYFWHSDKYASSDGIFIFEPAEENYQNTLINLFNKNISLIGD